MHARGGRTSRHVIRSYSASQKSLNGTRASSLNFCGITRESSLINIYAVRGTRTPHAGTSGPHFEVAPALVRTRSLLVCSRSLPLRSHSQPVRSRSLASYSCTRTFTYAVEEGGVFLYGIKHRQLLLRRL